MRILMLSWEYPPRIVGGISRVVYSLAQKLGEFGNDVHVVTCREGNQVEEEIDKYVHVHRVNICEIDSSTFISWVHQMNFSFLEKSVKLINEKDGFDIVHAHDWLTAFAARSLKNIYMIPLISTIHATEAGRNHGIRNDIQRYINSVEWWLTYESWRVIVNSRFMKEEVKNNFQLPEDKIKVIPNGINSDKFKNYQRDILFRRNYAADNEKIILFVGRLVNEKGAHILINAVPKVLQYYNDAKFVIVGRGPQFDYLNRIANEMNISHKIYFTGYIGEEELAKLYKCSDVAVFPSLYEPFGIVVLEGMLANVPVVVSDAGGLDEIVEHGVDGMKSYAGNPNSLADSILEILYNPGKAEKMKEKALEKVQLLYNWDVIAKQTLDVYKEVVKGRGGG